MAMSATIHKASIAIADMNRQYYQQHDLTIAQHPSENDFRLMVKLIVFALNASERLAFTKGLSVDNEPELWDKSLADEIELWIDFGQADEKRIRKACGLAKNVKVYTYHKRKSAVWWKQNEKNLSRCKNLSVYHLNAEGCEALIGRKMNLNCLIDEDSIVLSDDNNSVTVTFEKLTG